MPSTRKNIMLGTAGHVDHGKTALVRLLTGCETDTLAVEKQRGLTIELGFAPCHMADQRIVGIVDVPGHVSFIRNMVAGAHGVDVVILVVAADDGVMPQTREHLDILTLLGARHGLVALTKIDLVDDELRALAIDDVKQFVAGTFLEGAAICPLSNVTGVGFDAFFAALDKAVAACRARPASGLFRLWVERSFAMRGFGQVASGIPISGEVRVGERLCLLPSGQVGRVRRLEVYGSAAEVGRAGECVALNLVDVGHKVLTRGSVLCPPGAFEPVAIAEAELHLLGHASRPLRHHAEAHLHVGTAHVMARVVLLAGARLEPGEAGLVQLRLAEPLPLAAGDRFVLRSGLAGAGGQHVTTVGGGRILDTSNIRLRRRRQQTLTRLAARSRALDDPPAWCALHLAEANAALNATALAQRAQLPVTQVDALLRQLQLQGLALDAGGGRFVHRATVTALAQRSVDALAEFHRRDPLRLGLEPVELAKALDVPGGLLELSLRQLLEQGRVVKEGTLIAAAGHEPPIGADDLALCRRIESALQAAHLATPALATLADELATSREHLNVMIRFLADRGALVVLDDTTVMHRDAVAAARQVALDLFARADSFTTVEYRDALGVSRKYVIPLLDYFDKIRLTVRSGSRRTPGALARGTDCD